MILSETVIYRGKEIPVKDLKKHSLIPIAVRCDSCGKEFVSTKYQLIRNGHELCQACALQKKLGKSLPKGYESGRLTVICPSERKSGYSVCKCSCGNVIEVANYSLKTQHTRSCGCLQKEKALKTANERLSQYHHKEAHPRWKGGVSPERNCIESTNEYKTWKRAVLAKGKCEKCGSTSNLVAHHICNFLDYPAIRFENENGACLCEKCHRQFHKIYGLRDTTREEYEEFINKEKNNESHL